jgi:hypothetical protein
MSEYQEIFPIQSVIIGKFVDTITRYDEFDNVIESVETAPVKNIITVPISTLVAGLLKGEYAGNFSFWAVGTGQQASSPYLTNLVAEYNRKQVAINFVDNNNAVSTTPTNRLIMTISWAKGELGTVQLTEFGLFSGTGASAPNGGLMLDYVPHAPISLDSTLSLSRKIYFTF